MRRSISYTEPRIALAGEVKTWKFIFNAGSDLPKGTRLKFDLNSKGRDFDWEIPQTNLRSKKNLIWMEAFGEGDKALAAKEVFIPGNPLPQFEFTLPKEVKVGSPIFIFVGSPDKTNQNKGNRAQTHTLRRRSFFLYVDPKGKGEYKETDTFHLDVRGGALHSIRIIAPSMVTKNQRFDVIVRFEDEFGNLTSNAPEGTLIEFSYEKLRENMNWKLFVPETGFINLPNLYFNESGIYRIRLKNMSNQETFLSAPIKCFAENRGHLFWGLLHGESLLWDATENIESCLRYQRDEQAFQFFSTSSFESEEETSSKDWKNIHSHIAEFNEDERFTTFLGMFWAGLPSSEGMRQIVYLKDNKPLLRRKESKANNLKKIYKGHTPKDFISIPSFTMGSTTPFNFETFNPDYEKVVEIYNAWGSSECTKSEGNTRPITSKSRKGIKEKAEGSIRRALNKNHRFGFVAGGFDDRGVFEDFFDTGQVQYSPGLTAIIAQQQTRDGLAQALVNRSCYATTGARIVIGLFIAGQPMGSILDAKSKPGLFYNRHITGFIVGTAPIQEVILIRGGSVYHKINPKEDTFEFKIDDSDLLDKVALKCKDEDKTPFTYYYLRATQTDGHIAWSSPIWVDLIPSTTTEKKKKI